MARVDCGALLDGVHRLVVVAPHPDDEVLGCGGFMAQARSAGREVLVVSVSDGEACYPGDPFWTPGRLRETRRRELRAALAALGLRPVEVVLLGVPDGGVDRAAAFLADRLAAHLRRDDLILVPWEKDGHPDHEACNRAVRSAAEAFGCRTLEYPVWGWHWASPSSSELARVRAMRLELPRSVCTSKRRAIACFTTQTGECEPPIDMPVLPRRVRRRFERSFEVFFA
jgi:LmbE family N-acetylglucosaminyl deacetylase